MGASLGPWNELGHVVATQSTRSCLAAAPELVHAADWWKLLETAVFIEEFMINHTSWEPKVPPAKLAPQK